MSSKLIWIYKDNKFGICIFLSVSYCETTELQLIWKALSDIYKAIQVLWNNIKSWFYFVTERF